MVRFFFSRRSSDLPNILSDSMCFLSSLEFDLDLLRGKTGCRPGAFLIYYGCRYLSTLTVVMLFVYNNAAVKVQLDVSAILLRFACVLTKCVRGEVGRLYMPGMSSVSFLCALADATAGGCIRDIGVLRVHNHGHTAVCKHLS